ncbi:hypothetical protein GOBAR_AA18748 [Gossypium barbadense]|uniref:S-acyltransferase n=1 Tax=Gossypium barbadense TaxID=3634 RepID=A0A2P5XEX5_GOSBA|nr:hypothetical protein GOBAR_AA18748 [Gossypium barbadense]
MTLGFSFSLPVMVVVSAIAFVYFCTVFVFIDRWFGLMTSPGIMNAVAFTGVAVMCVLNYVFAIFMDPGRVPSNFLPDIEDSKVPIHEIKRKDDALAVLEGGDLRYCQKCSHFKPPRAHHCRVCKICVLRMDHHCTWINNCVGHANYKVFFVFVVYAVIACIYSLVLLVGSLTNDSQNDKQQSADSFRILYVISGLLLVPLSMALSGLLGWHIYLILQNKTTIEYHEGVRATWLQERAGNVYKHPYDLGAYDNLTTPIMPSPPGSPGKRSPWWRQQVIMEEDLKKDQSKAVLGSNIICWICPTSRHIGNGLRFRTAYDGLPVASTSK